MNAAELQSVLGPPLSNTKLIVVANREPYIHVKETKPARRSLLNWFGQQGERTTLSWMRPASGLVTALDPVMRRVRRHVGRARQRQRRSRRVGRARPRGGAARQAVLHAAARLAHAGRGGRLLLRLSPTTRCGRCATSPTRARSSTSATGQQYKPRQRRFARNGDRGDRRRARRSCFVQDYHFALLPRLVKEARPDAIVCQFWHIPWPNREAFRICPWGEEILRWAARQRPAAASTSSSTATTSSTRWTRRMESRVDYEQFAVVARRAPDQRAAVPDQHRPGAWAGLPKAAERAATSRADRASALGLGRASA